MIKKTVIVLLLLFVTALLSRNIFGRFVAEKELSEFMGSAVTVDKVEISPNFLRYRLKGIRVSNPPEFGVEPMAVVPDVAFEFSLWKYLVYGKTWISKIFIDFDRFEIIRNANGELNVDHFRRTYEGRRPGMRKESQSIRIQEYIVSIDTVTFEDAGTPKIVMDLGIKGQVFRDVKDLDDLVRILITRIFYSKTFEGVGKTLGVDFQPASKQLMEAVKFGEYTKMSAGEIASTSQIGDLMNAFKDIGQQTAGAVRQGTGALVNTASRLWTKEGQE
jgi:hypothetical protein